MNGQRLDLSSVRVLVVDDSRQAIEVVYEVLVGFGITGAQRAITTAAAVRHLATEQFDLIMVDGDMPGHDGFDLVEHVRSIPSGVNFTVPIMILSSFTPRHKVIAIRDAGANLVVKKPVVPANLLEHIHWLARNPRQFVHNSAGYCGPDRRFQKRALPVGIEERRADQLKLMQQPERAMSQSEIDSMFG